MAIEASVLAGVAPRDFHPRVGMEMGKEKWLDAAGVRTRYFDEGQGERIVFVHGGNLGSNDGSGGATTWNVNFPVLARQHNVIAFDKLGQGFTENPKTDAGYSMDGIVKHAIATLEAIGKGPYHIVGHSRGGYVVTRLTMERPDLVKTCIVVSSGSTSPGTTRTRLIHKHAPLPRMTRSSQRFVYETYSHYTKLVTEEWLDVNMDYGGTQKHQVAMRKMNEEGLLKRQFLPELARQKAEVHRWLIESGMPCPTLIVWGFNDPTAHFDNGWRLIEMFMARQPLTELRLFNKAGHFVFKEYAAAFNRALDAWVKKHA